MTRSMVVLLSAVLVVSWVRMKGLRTCRFLLSIHFLSLVPAALYFLSDHKMFLAFKSPMRRLDDPLFHVLLG